MTARTPRPALSAPVRELSEGWRSAAACADVDPDAMFPPDGESTSSPAWRAAKAVCEGCPVLEACRAFYRAAGPDHVMYGVHGGLDPKEWKSLITEPGAPKQASVRTPTTAGLAAEAA